MQVEGSCHCGKLTFRAEIDPDGAFLCHCTDCQTMSGAAFRMAVRTPAENFTLLSGSPKTYVRVAESGRKRAQVFCGDCGTHIYATSADEDGEPKLYGVRVSLLKERAAIAPKRQFWARSACRWLGDIATFPAIELQAPFTSHTDVATWKKVTGSCHCGRIAFRAAVDPTLVSICHCNDCQVMSSSAFRVSTYTTESHFAFTGDRPAEYLKMAESGNPRMQAFCPHCGTQIYSAPVGDGSKILSLRVGTIAERRDLVPMRQIWVRSRLPWVTSIGAIPAHETQ